MRGLDKEQMISMIHEALVNLRIIYEDAEDGIVRVIFTGSNSSYELVIKVADFSVIIMSHTIFETKGTERTVVKKNLNKINEFCPVGKFFYSDDNSSVYFSYPLVHALIEPTAEYFQICIAFIIGIIFWVDDRIVCLKDDDWLPDIRGFFVEFLYPLNNFIGYYSTDDSEDGENGYLLDKIGKEMISDLTSSGLTCAVEDDTIRVYYGESNESLFIIRFMKASFNVQIKAELKDKIEEEAFYRNLNMINLRDMGRYFYSEDMNAVIHAPSYPVFSNSFDIQVFRNLCAGIIRIALCLKENAEDLSDPNKDFTDWAPYLRKL